MSICKNPQIAQIMLDDPAIRQSLIDAGWTPPPHSDKEACPFCGSDMYLRLYPSGGAGEPLSKAFPEVQVVCDFNRGGCGASTGFAFSPKQAIEKWNRRSYPCS